MDEIIYRHCVCEGTPYEAGVQLGNQLSNDGALIKSITTPLFGQPVPIKQAEETARQFEKYLPGINEEIKGFSDTVKVSYLDMVIYSSYIDIPGGCSHFVTLQDDGRRKKIMHGRNYDFDFSDAPFLITTRIKHNSSCTGFSCKIFGRFDGMNDFGLCVTTSSVDLKHTGRMGTGFIFPMVVRAMLERCADVYEAKEMLMDMPYAEYRNFLLSDALGDATLVEVSPREKSCKQIKVDNQYGYLFSANHFAVQKNDELQPVKNSVVREQKMEEVLSAGKDMTLNDIKALLAKPYPNGLSFPYYHQGMGTLWSVIYEPVSELQHICFGSPGVSSWRTLKNSDALDYSQETICFDNINAPEDLWE